MFVFLLTLLGMALVVTFAGLLLSYPKVHAPEQREISYAGRNVGARRGREIPYTTSRRRSVSGGKGTGQTRTVHSSIAIERSWWAQIFASINIANLFSARAAKQTPWLGILLILLALFGFSMLSLKTLLLNTGLALSIPAMAGTAANSTASSPDPLAVVSGASKNLLRINQLDTLQYASPQEHDKWAYSTCSAASMTEVINAYGHTYRITDILKVEAGLGEISPDLGLLEPQGIDRTVDHFGFKTVWLNNASLDKVIEVANHGRPIIVSFPPDRWTGGHLLVVRGGNDKEVFLADSSSLNMQTMARSQFMKYWGGMAVAILPK